MILGFNKRFEMPILKGTKKHTIREDKHRRWRVGMAIQMACNVRTARYRCFKENVCRGLQQIFMSCENGMIEVSIDGKYFYDLDTLAVNDGFNDVDEFIKWFFPAGKGEYWGRIIHWTDLKY
jgi:hypothetical protein